MAMMLTLAGRLAQLSPRLARLAAGLLGSPFRYLSGLPLERQLLILKLPYAKLALVNDLALVSTLLNDREGMFPKSGDLELLLKPLIGRGVFGQPGGDAVKQMRRVYIRGLSRIPDAEVDRVARQLTRRYLDEWRKSTRPVAVPSELSRLALDIVTQATLASCFSPQESKRFVDLFFKYHKRANPFLLLLAPRDSARRLALFQSFGLEEIGTEMRTLIRKRFLMPLLDERSEARRAPFASALLEATRPPDGDSVPLEQDEARQAAILDEISVMLLAGHETTASVLSWLLWELAGIPEEQDRIARLVHAQASERSGFATDSRQGALDVASPWIAAMIQESLRLYPPIAFLLRETTGDVTLRGKPVSANSYIVVSPWTIQRHRRVWPTPDAFDPKRWMEGAPPRAMENRTAFIPFGQGPRVCPGKRFADLEMNAILSELLGASRFARAGGGLPRPLGSLTSRPDRDFRLVVAAAQSA